jgi:hypothetical protein
MRTTNRRPIATSLLLLGTMVLLTGCGEDTSYLDAAAAGGSAQYSATSGRSVLDDPVLAEADALESEGGLPGTDSVYTQAIADWNENEGGLSDLDSDIDDLGWEDDLLPAGYGGNGNGWDNLYGYGNNILAAGLDAGWNGGSGLMAAGFDPGFEDPGLMDAGFEDPGFVDAGFEDPGFIDPGFEDPGFVDAGFDPGFVDAGVADVGFDPGFADVGAVDVGAVDVGMVDAGIVF